MKFPALSKKEWYLIAGITVVAVIAVAKLIHEVRNDPNAPENAETEFKKDAATAIAGAFGFLFLNRALPVLLARIGLGAVGITALAGWPLALTTAGVFAAFGGYEMVQSAFPILPRIGDGKCRPGYTEMRPGLCVKVEAGAQLETDQPVSYGTAIVMPSDNLDHAWQTGAFNA